MTEPRLSLQEQVALLEERLGQAQRLTALGELASTTAHEFNNVLTTIINYAKLGLRHRDQATRDKAFERILSAGTRAARVTNGILGLARNRSATREPTDIVRLIQDTLLLLERELARYRIRVETYFQPVPEALTNGNQIQQVLLNILINARQAMSEGGLLTIRVQSEVQGDWVDVTIRDTGTGIPEDKLPHIFDRFFTTKSGPDSSGKGGTGLGLAFCRDVIEAHQGRIRVESTVGKGTAFTLRLPAAKRPTAPPPLPVRTDAPTESPNTALN